MLGALALLVWNFWPVIELEAGYQLKTLTQEPAPKIAGISTDNSQLHDLLLQYQPLDKEFGIIIPKIDANAHIVKDVDPYDMAIYSKALGKGIAHALGSALPGSPGNTFLFAHSGRNFYDNSGQNVQFYLLDKLEKDDQIIVYYFGHVYLYSVFNLDKVSPNDVSFLQDQSQEKNILTLMSCWPAGVNYKRQIVQAKLILAI